MIDLTGKSVFVRTQEEYSKVLRIAKLQGFRWARGKHLNAIDIPLPNMLNFYDERIVTYSSDERKMYEASEIVACEKKLEEAMAHVKYFANNKDRMSLTDKVIESMLLLANTVESQLEEVKQMERLTIDDMIKALRCVASQDTVGDCYADHENFIHIDDKHKRIVCGTGEDLRDYISGKEAVGCPYHQNTYGCCFEDGELYWLKDVAELLEELKSYKEAEKQGLLVRLPCKVGDTVYRVNAGAKQPIIPMTVSEIHFLCYKNERAVRFDAIGKEDMGESCYRLEDIGRIVFLTHEEAERKLEEMKNND